MKEILHRTRRYKPLPPDLLEASGRFWAKVDKSGDCWLFTGAGQHGYGVFSIGGQPFKAHRVAYALSGGAISSELTVDHECHNRALAKGECRAGPCPHRACCNPQHLIARSLRENVLAGGGIAAKNARKTECLRGHDISTRRDCAECQRGHSQRSRRVRPDSRSACQYCEGEYSRSNLSKHEVNCRRLNPVLIQKPGTVQHECGAWISRANISRHRKNCRGHSGRRLPRGGRGGPTTSLVVFWDEGNPNE